MSSHSSNSNGINDIMSVKTLKNDTKCINTEKIYVKESMVASSISEKVTPSTKLTTSITNKKPTNLTNVQNLHLLKNNKNNNNDKNNSISTQLNTNSILLNRNNLTIERQLLQTYNYFMYNGQLINNSIYTNITHDNNITYYQAVNILSMMAPLSIMQSSPYPTQMTYEFIPICQTQKDDTKDSQKDQISNKKLDSNSQSHTTNLHHHHHHHQHQQNSQHLKSTKSSKTRHNKRGTTNSNSSNDNKTSSHPWLASNLKGHTDDIHDIDFSNNGKFLASCSEATNNNSSSNGLHHHHHHQHHHRVIRNDRRKESTSTDSTGSGTEDINNSSSNEDSSVPYITNVTKNKKSKPRCNRRHNRKNHTKHNTDIDDDNHNKNNQRNEQSESFSSSSPNSSPTASPQQKSSLRKSIKNSTKSSSKQNNVANFVNHQHNNHQIIQKEKNCELNHFIKISQAVIPPLRQHTKLNLQESELVKFLRYYIVDPNLLRIYGYPVESASYEGSIEIFKCLPRPFTHFKTNGIVSNNRSTTPRSDIINKSDGLIAPPGYKKWKTNNDNNNDNNVDDNDDSCMMQMQSSDSGNGSETSSPASVDSDDTSENGEEETTTTFYTPDGSYQIFNNYSQSLKKQCVRCKKEFLVDENGEYLTKEECFYHWGKLQQIYTSNRTFGYQYSCCNGDQYSIGCAKNRLHVWTGITVGINGPYDDFIRTSNKLSTTNINNIYKKNCNINDINIKTNGVTNVGGDDVYSGKVYALDCEMCFTGLGLEVTKITIVSSEGHLVYETFVKPKCEIVDYNTRFSGITEKDITSKNNNVKTLEQVQNDLLEFIDEDTLLIGHALDNDLRALKILHTNIIDTSITFPHVNGFPYRRSLKTLTKYYLNRDIQNGGESGHCSFEDSRACLELMLWRVRKDFRLILEQ